MTRLFAHSAPPSAPDQPWEPLEDHLRQVADRASGFGGAFGAAALGRYAGLWHDVGKASVAFQRDVLGAGLDEAEADAEDEDGAAATAAAPRRRRVDHSTAGAQHAEWNGPPAVGRVLAYAIAGHHGHLLDWDAPGSDACLSRRLKKPIEPYTPPAGIPMASPTGAELSPTGFRVCGAEKRKPFQLAVLTRMVYSALVDADRLETEKFCDPERASLRPAETTRADVLLGQLNRFLDQLREARRAEPAPIDRHRDAVLAACRRKAALPPGVFSLTVPTGGGKTLASLAFALEHAQHHGLRRVVYALPFTSIIEQTAATFRKVFNNPQDVLEHHSSFDASSIKNHRDRITHEMAAENFDAPVIVSTNVQLFESLFASRGSTCRKLHRLAGSVIILDEAQSIPPRLLRPTLAVIEELALNYRCTFLLCTATQPAILRREDFPIGLETSTEIVDQPEDLYRSLRRVRVQRLGRLEDDAIATRLADHDAALCIVNTRKHARTLVSELINTHHCEAIHLSAAMCPAHRSDRVAEIKRRLCEGDPCRVVSTQVIEAGVDVDFPVVYRALAGFDAIAQAAGRCNREGRSLLGEVFVFETDHRPAASLRTTIDAAAALFPDHQDPLALDAIEAYFRRVYWREGQTGQRPWDTRDVMGCFAHLGRYNFREAARRFRWIDSITTPIIVPYGQGASLIDAIRLADEPDWTLLRRAQPFSVAVYGPEFAQLQENQTISPYFDGRVWVLNNPAAYDPLLGLRLDVVGLDERWLAAW